MSNEPRMAASLLPPEKPEATRKRSWIIVSFWVVIIFLGVPTWWQTTSIPRAALPLEDMLNWSNDPETRPIYTVPIRISAPEIPCESAKRIVSQVASVLNEETGSWGFQTLIELVSFLPTSAKGQTIGGARCGVKEIQSDVQSSTLDIELIPGVTFSTDALSGATPAKFTYNPSELEALSANLIHALQGILAAERATVSYEYYVQGRPEPSLRQYVDGLPDQTKQSIHNSVARAFKPSPKYHITFSLFTAGGTPSSWDVQSQLDQYIAPLLHVLSSTMSFSVTTQVQLYSAFSPSIQPYQVEGVDGWFLRKQDLTAFVNTAEWPLSPSIGTGPTINFVMYVPAKQQIPLRVEGNHGNNTVGGSWLVPQWGGISIFNAPVVRKADVNRDEIIMHLGSDLLDPVFDVFQTQLLALLGVPVSASIPLPLRLKAFQRLSGLSLHLRTSSNLGSLARLAQHLNNIPIPWHVSELVDFAMTTLKTYRTDSNMESAISAANEGYRASEKAFFDKSMVGQVYFPDEHKVAVYLPLLGPIGVPLVIGVLREIKMLVTRLKS